MSETAARIDKIRFKTYRPQRKAPEPGDRKIIRGVMHVRCYEMVQQYGDSDPYSYSTSRGKRCFEWVPESEADLESFVRKRYLEHNRRLAINWKEID